MRLAIWSLTPKAPALEATAGITLDDEHDRAMVALGHARDAVGLLNRGILETARNNDPAGWKDMRLATLNMASWVGYDLDGRDDTHWTDSFLFRLCEKAAAMGAYAGRLADILDNHDPAANETILHNLVTRLEAENVATQADCARFASHKSGASSLTEAADVLTERAGKLANSAAIADELRALATATEILPIYVTVTVTNLLLTTGLRPRLRSGKSDRK